MRPPSTTYRAIHKWLDRTYKKVECESKKCNSSKETKHLNWSLIHGKSHERIRQNYKILCRSCHTKYDMTVEWKNKIGENSKKMQTPEFRKRHGDKMRELLKEPERKKKLIEGLKTRWKEPEYRKKMITHLKNRYNRPGYREKFAESIKKSWIIRKTQT